MRHSLSFYALFAMIVLATPVLACDACAKSRSSRSSVGATPTGPALSSGPLDEKFYNPASKSYFELRAMPTSTTATWDQANAFARSAEFKGVKGRLAVVDDKETHEFLRDTYVLVEPAWFGLRYWCGSSKLSWPDGTVYPLTAFKAWMRPWMYNGNSCARGAYNSPVAYSDNSHGFLWQALPANAGLRYYFVEYPTGGKEPPPPEAAPAEGAAPDAKRTGTGGPSEDGAAAPASGVEEAPKQP